MVGSGALDGAAEAEATAVGVGMGAMDGDATWVGAVVASSAAGLTFGDVLAQPPTARLIARTEQRPRRNASRDDMDPPSAREPVGSEGQTGRPPAGATSLESHLSAQDRTGLHRPATRRIATSSPGRRRRRARGQ